MRLDRLIKSSLHIGRRQARDYIAGRKATVNGELELDGSRMIGPFDHVKADGQILQARHPRNIILHKPAGIVSATTDPEHATVVDLIREPWASELHLAGRLDRHTSGLVILTNDSRFSEALTLPERKIPKTYLVGTDRAITLEALSGFERGIFFAKEGVTTQPAEVELLDNCRCRLTIFEGKHHQIKRMFARFSIKVTVLHREAIGRLRLNDLNPGDYRELEQCEIAQSLLHTADSFL